MVTSPACDLVNQPRPRKVVGAASTSRFANKWTPITAAPSLPNPSSAKRLTPDPLLRSPANGLPIRVRAKVTQANSAASRHQPSPSPDSKSSVAWPATASAFRITAKVSRLNPLGHSRPVSPAVPHQALNDVASDNSSASQSFKSFPQPSPHTATQHPSRIKLPPHVTQRSRPARSRANTGSDRCPSRLDSDTFSSISSCSLQADAAHEAPVAHLLALSIPSQTNTSQSYPLTRPLEIPGPPDAHTSLNHTFDPRTTRAHKQKTRTACERLMSSTLADSPHPPLPQRASANLASPVTPKTTDVIASDGNILHRPSVSVDSSDSSPLSAHWTKDRSTSDPCSSRSSIHELDQARLEDETASYAVGEELKEDDARVNRKILDLEISNSSLLAINARLERTKLKQSTEIRDLRKKLRERSLGHVSGSSVILDEVMSAQEESEAEETDKMESLMKDDVQFAEAIRIMDNLITRAKQALVYQPEDPRSKKVLNRIDIRADDQEEEEDSDDDQEPYTQPPPPLNHSPSLSLDLLNPPLFSLPGLSTTSPRSLWPAKLPSTPEGVISFPSHLTQPGSFSTVKIKSQVTEKPSTEQTSKLNAHVMGGYLKP